MVVLVFFPASLERFSASAFFFFLPVLVASNSFLPSTSLNSVHLYIGSAVATRGLKEPHCHIFVKQNTKLYNCNIQSCCSSWDSSCQGFSLPNTCQESWTQGAYILFSYVTDSLILSLWSLETMFSCLWLVSVTPIQGRRLLIYLPMLCPQTTTPCILKHVHCLCTVLNYSIVN